MDRVITLVCVLLAAPAFAQPPHADVVASAKAALEARGEDLRGPCGAFEITKTVAWLLRAEGAGLLAKPGGNNCQGFAVDIVMYPDGRIVDILSASGDVGGNGPQWDASKPPVDRSLWRAPSDPGETPPPPPVVKPPPSPPPPAPVPASWLTPEWLQSYADQIVTRTTNAITLSHDDLTNQHRDQTADLKAAIDSPAWYMKLVKNPLADAVIASLGTCALSPDCRATLFRVGGQK